LGPVVKISMQFEPSIICTTKICIQSYTVQVLLLTRNLHSEAMIFVNKCLDISSWKIHVSAKDYER
jgi:hypothetical protein